MASDLAFFLGSIALTATHGIPQADILGVLLVCGVLPLGLSSSLAADTFAGERERRSLETLLCAPQTAWPLFLGKGLSALLPGVAMSWAAMVACATVLVWTGNGPAPLAALLAGGLVVPSLGALSTSVALAASRRMRTVRAASQMAALGLLPILAAAQILPRLVQSRAMPESVAWIGISLVLLGVAGALIARSVKLSNPADLLA